jgi:hypothetical protein
LDFKVKVWDIAAAYAIAQAAGQAFHFIGEPAFPLRSFHVRLPNCPFYTGSDYFCKLFQDRLESHKDGLANPVTDQSRE